MLQQRVIQGVCGRPCTFTPLVFADRLAGILVVAQRVLAGNRLGCLGAHQAIPRFDIYTRTLLSGCKQMRCGLHNSCAARILLQSNVKLLQSHRIITPILLLERQGLLGHGRTHIPNTFTPALITPIRFENTPNVLKIHRHLLVERRIL